MPGEQAVSWTVVFVGVLVTYVTFVVMLLPQGYNLWVVLGAATTTCVVAGQVTRAVRLALAGEQAAGAGTHRSLLGRAVAAWIREAVAEEQPEPGGRADAREPGDPGRGDPGRGGRAGGAVREPDPAG
ncbi:hypothetical protein HTZ77_17165 [Nonomuraea sp. SMC257]|uniref:Uncharacterized protein n=1 Tax=Nonomuraea montanisoli TaxID=2741721 RepID=A0A7Y6I7H5_9ACTN|nr:hypothetical protein [Nonomuraea montanisoli]NUW33148.1 hypothetical protein [Nonomuraea montanisoli]